MPLPKIVTQYEYEKFEKPEVNFSPSDKNSKSKTIQSDMDAADINKIMARFEKTGVFIDAQGVERKPMFGDFSEVADYHTQLSAIRRVDAAFLALPAEVRNRFDNDAEKLLRFLENPANKNEAIKLGLIEPEIIQQTEEDRIRLEKEVKDKPPVVPTGGPASGGPTS